MMKAEPQKDKDPKQGWMSLLQLVVAGSQDLPNLVDAFFHDSKTKIEKQNEKDAKDYYDRKSIGGVPAITKTYVAEYVKDMSKQLLEPVIVNLHQQAECQQKTQHIVFDLDERVARMQTAMGDFNKRVSVLEENHISVCCVFGCFTCGFSCKCCGC